MIKVIDVHKSFESEQVLKELPPNLIKENQSNSRTKR